jgi:hypothetical protein
MLLEHYKEEHLALTGLAVVEVIGAEVVEDTKNPTQWVVEAEALDTPKVGK